MVNRGDRLRYKERARVQCLQWAMGSSKHNHIDDECCPDFSCCVPQMKEDDAGERWRRYHDKYGRKTNASR